MSMTNPDGEFRRGFKPSPLSVLFLHCHKWMDYFSDRVKKLLILMVSIFLLPACLSMTHYDHQKTPQEIVYIFMSTYGTPRISQLAHYTTPFFRNYKPEELWVIETWEVLSELGYRHVKGTILEERIKEESAIIVTSSSIETVAGETLQREIYCFIKTGEGWKLDDLLVEEETVEAEKFSL